MTDIPIRTVSTIVGDSAARSRDLAAFHPAAARRRSPQPVPGHPCRDRRQGPRSGQGRPAWRSTAVTHPDHEETIR